MHSHIGCICVIFLQSEFSSVSSNCLPQQMHIRIGCIWTIFHLSEFSNVSTNCLHEQLQKHIGCTCMIFLQNAFSYVSLIFLPDQRHSHTGCICLNFPCAPVLCQSLKWKCPFRWQIINWTIIWYLFWFDRLNFHFYLWRPLFLMTTTFPYDDQSRSCMRCRAGFTEAL